MQKEQCDLPVLDISLSAYSISSALEGHEQNSFPRVYEAADKKLLPLNELD